MASVAKRMVGKTLVTRVSGSRPGFFRSLVVAAIVGVGAGVVTYRGLRSGG